MRTLRRALAAVAVPAAAGVVLALGLTGCGGDEPPDTLPTDQSASPPPSRVTDDASEHASGQAACPPSTAKGGPARQATRVARCAVVAYTEFSWRDEDHRAFVERFARYATGALATELRELFGEDVPAEAAAWRELVRERTVQRAVVLGSEAVRTDGGWKVTLDVDTERRTADDPDWEPYGDVQTWELTVVRDGGRWRVADIS